MIFADLTSSNPAITIGALIVAIAAAAKCANEISDFVNRFREKPPVGEQVGGLRAWIEHRFATKEEVQHAKELFAQTIVNQDTRITGIRAEVSSLSTLIRENEVRHEERAVALHDRINPLLAALGELKGKAQSHSQRLAQIRDGRTP